MKHKEGDGSIVNISSIVGKVIFVIKFPKKGLIVT